jgi:hypothetical protein
MRLYCKIKKQMGQPRSTPVTFDVVIKSLYVKTPDHFAMLFCDVSTFKRKS